MIIFGMRGITRTHAKGVFNCPGCRSSQNYGHKKVRRFFTLYFIPVIPLKELGEYVECESCKDTYHTRVLMHTSPTSAQEFEAEYHRAITKVMIHVLLADGVINDTEVDMVCRIYQQLTRNEIDRNLILTEINRIQNSNENFHGALQSLQGSLNDRGKELVLVSALHVAMADGEFQQAEKQMIQSIGIAMGMTPSHVNGVVHSFLESSKAA